MIAASVLAGGLLAVVGQVYQTGADAFELFIAWTILILPWVLASRSAAHWLLWLVVGYAALGLYGEQVMVPRGSLSANDILVNLGVLTAPILAVRELAVRRGFAWLSGHWTRLVLLIAGFGLLFPPGFGFVFDANDDLLAVLALVAALAGAALAYRRWLPDMAALSIVAGVASLLLMSAGYRVLDEVAGFDWDASLKDLTLIGLLIAWCVLVTGAAAKTMRRIHASAEPGA